VKATGLWAVSVTTTSAAEEPVAALLERIFERRPTSYTDAETGHTTVTVFCDRRSQWTRGRRADLLAGLESLRALQASVGPATIRVKRLADREWTESWKRHFKPLVIGEALLIKPSWSRRRPRPGQAVVVLDPGLSFGTGQHATTAFCLEQLVACRQSDKPQAFLDVGTGSGILAIAAAKLGYAPVDAFDHDPVAFRVASGNARANRVSKQIRFCQADLTRLPLRTSRRYAVVCANLLADLLVRERQRLANRVAPGGRLVVAGILSAEFEAVRRSFEGLGFKLIASRAVDEWRSGGFESRESNRFA
jgi:ribosomal protein L11 methyltransferase